MADLRPAIDAVRRAVAMARAPHTRVLAFTGGSAAWETLDELCTMTLPTREEAAVGLWLDEQAYVIADVLLVRGRREWTAFVDTAMEPVAHAWSHQHPGAHTTELDHGVLHVVGPSAPALLAAAFGDEHAQLPLFGWARLMRGVCVRFSKSGEHGFVIGAPRADLSRIEAALRAAGGDLGLERVPWEAIEACELQNGFFRVRHEGARGVTPVEAGVQWMTEPGKPCVGGGSLQRQQLAGVRERVAYLIARGDVRVGARVSFGGLDVGEVLVVGPAPNPAETMVAAVVRSSHAHSGIDGFVLSRGTSRALARIVTAPLVIDPNEPLARASASRIAVHPATGRTKEVSA